MQHSKSWIYQTYIAFLASIGGMGWCIYDSPLRDDTKVWMGLCFLFAVSSTLTLSKTLRDIHIDEDKVSPLWVFQSWIAFLVSLSGFGWGLYHLPFVRQAKVMMGIILLFGISSAAAFAKTVRDVQELEESTTKANGHLDHPSSHP